MSSLIDEPIGGAPLALAAQGEPATRVVLRPTNVRYLALAWLTVAAALAYLCRNAIGVAESTIRGQLGLTLEQSGWFMGAFFWSYALLQIPGGWFAERFGTRVAMSVFAIAWSLATFGIAIAPALWLLIAAQLLMGAAQGGLLPASYNSVGHWMPVGERTFGCGVLAAGMQVGAIAASALAGALIARYDWRWTFVAFAVPGVVWAIGFLVRFRDQPSQTRTVNAAERELIDAGRAPSVAVQESTARAAPQWSSLAASPIMWWLCGQQICRSAGYMFFASWLPTFLQRTCVLTVEYSGYLQGLVFLTIIPGAVLGGMLTDWIWRRTGNLRISRSGVGAGSLTICALFLLMSWFADGTTLIVACLAAGGFFAALAGPCAFSATIDIGGSRVPQVVAVMNMIGNFSAAACPGLTGRLFEWTENWSLILLLFAGIYLLGAICWLFVNPEKHLRSIASA